MDAVSCRHNQRPQSKSQYGPVSASDPTMLTQIALRRHKAFPIRSGDVLLRLRHHTTRRRPKQSSPSRMRLPFPVYLLTAKWRAVITIMSQHIEVACTQPSDGQDSGLKVQEASIFPVGPTFITNSSLHIPLARSPPTQDQYFTQQPHPPCISPSSSHSSRPPPSPSPQPRSIPAPLARPPRQLQSSSPTRTPAATTRLPTAAARTPEAASSNAPSLVPVRRATRAPSAAAILGRM